MDTARHQPLSIERDVRRGSIFLSSTRWLGPDRWGYFVGLVVVPSGTEATTTLRLLRGRRAPADEVADVFDQDQAPAV